MLASTLCLCACACAGAGAGDEREEGAPPSTVAQAIINGESDSGDAAVVALVRGNDIFCSGTLISRNVVLTAAHCVKYVVPDSVFFGTRLDQPGRAVRVLRVLTHPRFDEDTVRNDVGLVELEEDGPAPPALMATEPLAQSVVGHQQIRLVGFGVPRPGATRELEKRSGTTVISDLTALDFRFHDTPSQTCLGDSGGPSFMSVDGHDVLIGVTSSGDVDCKVYGRQIRVDKYRSFIDPFVADAAVVHYQAKGSGCQLRPSKRRSPTEGILPVALALLWLVAKRTSGGRSPT